MIKSKWWKIQFGRRPNDSGEKDLKPRTNGSKVISKYVPWPDGGTTGIDRLALNLVTEYFGLYSINVTIFFFF